ncbi:MAG: acyltransferase [Chloroflexi bacterium]|nr:MAG: acyltransferase [Chloroflexota bacterium]
MIQQLRYYVSGQARSLPAYILEQTILNLFGWMPTILGVGARALAYRLIMRMDGMAAIENGVRILHAGNVRLGKNVYLDRGVYLHALPTGITIGDDTFVMYHTMLHVFNFRDLPRAGITIGKNCFLGEYNVIRGQGGVHIGNGVYTGPMVQIVAVNHVFSDPHRPIREQGITAQGIVIEDDVWIGAGAKILDGVRVGRGSVIGAGAVVTGDIPPYSLAVGAPAKPVKDRRELNGSAPSAGDVFLGKLEQLKSNGG